MLLTCGLRQGSVLSPCILFSVYLNDLLVNIRKSKLGCHIKLIAFMFLCMPTTYYLLLILSMRDMQLFINICLQEFLVLDMKINLDKSAALHVGKRYKVIVVPPMADSHVLRLCY